MSKRESDTQEAQIKGQNIHTTYQETILHCWNGYPYDTPTLCPARIHSNKFQQCTPAAFPYQPYLPISRQPSWHPPSQGPRCPRSWFNPSFGILEQASLSPMTRLTSMVHSNHVPTSISRSKELLKQSRLMGKAQCCGVCEMKQAC